MPLIVNLDFSIKSELNEFFEIILNGKLNKKLGRKVGIISLGETNQILLNNFIEKIKSFSNKYEIIFSDGLIDANKCDSVLLLLNNSKLLKKEAQNFKDKIDLLNIPIVGLINLIGDSRN